MIVTAKGKAVLVERPGGTEVHAFGSAKEAKARAVFVAEALTWVKTPFVDCGDVKGPNGAVDCAMMMARCAIDTGLVAPFDPRPYAPRWHLHRTEELFIDWITSRLGAREVERPRIGDIVVWMFGKTFSHGAILVNAEEVVHAYYAAGMTLVSRLDEPLLQFLPLSGCKIARPVRYFDLWSARV